MTSALVICLVLTSPAGERPLYKHSASGLGGASCILALKRSADTGRGYEIRCESSVLIKQTVTSLVVRKEEVSKTYGT